MYIWKRYKKYKKHATDSRTFQRAQPHGADPVGALSRTTPFAGASPGELRLGPRVRFAPGHVITEMRPNCP